MKGIVTGFLLLLAPAVPLADAVIDGGFGIRLGETLDVRTLEQAPGSARDDHEYTFKPENPYAPLTEYSVFVAPQTGIVYGIQAIGHFNSGDDCRDELQRLEQALSEKYGPPNRDQRARVAGISRINFGSEPRTVVAICNGIFGKYKLKLSYRDAALEKRIADSATERRGPPEARDTTGL